MVTKPFKKASVHSITQGFHSQHNGLDMVTPPGMTAYGTPLCAPERVRIMTVIGNTYTANDSTNTKRGYGLFMKGLETGYIHQFWHTLPIIPVSVGDIIQRGKIVAFMGNAGYVKRNGVYVPLERRNDSDKPGTHLHWEMMEKYENNKEFGHVDPRQFIDWSLEPTYTVMDQLTTYTKVLAKIARLIA